LFLFGLALFLFGFALFPFGLALFPFGLALFPFGFAFFPCSKKSDVSLFHYTLPANCFQSTLPHPPWPVMHLQLLCVVLTVFKVCERMTAP